MLLLELKSLTNKPVEEVISSLTEPDKHVSELIHVYLLSRNELQDQFERLPALKSACLKPSDSNNLVRHNVFHLY